MSVAGPIKHVAIIMDGNGRWAKKRKLPRLMGHRAGAKVAKKILRASMDFGVSVVTLFAFSTDNWKRPLSEIDHLMTLFSSSLRKNIDELDEQGVCVRCIGDLSQLGNGVRKEMQEAMLRTEANNRMNLNIAMNYTGKWDIVQAVQHIASDVLAGKVVPNAIDESLINSHLSTQELPSPDLLIRTSGEQRISNFMLWQCDYSEFYFTETLWPDFSVEEYKRALDEFSKRERRFGQTSKQLEKQDA